MFVLTNFKPSKVAICLFAITKINIKNKMETVNSYF